MAKAETKTILKAYSTVESKLSTLPPEDGQLIFVYDKKKIILDNHGVRTVYEQIQTIETEEQRNDLLAPIDSFYFVIETSILWRYTNGHWNQITTSPQEQIDRIVAEGAKQIKEVQDKGAEVLQSIPEDFTTQMETKLDKQQGIENKGKALVIGEDGNVVPGEVASGGGDGIAIINTMSGESPLVIPDSAERVNKRLELGGKTEQFSTKGLNLFNYKDFVDISTYADEGAGYRRKYLQLKPNTSYRMTIFKNRMSPSMDATVMFIGNKEKYDNTAANGKIVLFTSTDKKSATIVTGESGQIVFKLNKNSTPELQEEYLSKADIILSEGSTEIPYEPYTGGKPSPSPEYPQEIKNVGKWNEETQKYEVDVKVTNAEQNWSKEQTLTLTSDRPITKWDRLVEQGGEIGWLYNSVNETIDGKTGKWSTQPASKIFYRTDITFPIVVPFCIELLGYDYSMGGYKKDTGITINNLGILCITLPEEVELTLDAYKQYLADNPLHVLYKGDSEEFVPLPQSEQNAIRALKAYHPTTVITADGGELDPDIKVTYTADTKNYIDGKVSAKVASILRQYQADTANLLSLMPMETQATMIENDTNNILNNLESEEAHE